MKLTVNEFIERLNTASETISFDEVMNIISDHYHYQPSSFTNGELINQAGTNEGSCKVFAFAKKHNLSEQATLNCFAQFYRDDVLNNPTGTDHGNIRSFIKHGWTGITIANTVLTAK